jgi:hypothetical protein
MPGDRRLDIRLRQATASSRAVAPYNAARPRPLGTSQGSQPLQDAKWHALPRKRRAARSDRRRRSLRILLGEETRNVGSKTPRGDLRLRWNDYDLTARRVEGVDLSSVIGSSFDRRKCRNLFLHSDRICLRTSAWTFRISRTNANDRCPPFFIRLM